MTAQSFLIGAAVAVLSVSLCSADCTCLGDRGMEIPIPKQYKRFINRGYGSKCKAWDKEFKYCQGANALKPDRSCWCEASWCYVDSSCKTAHKSDFFKDAESLFYSYTACDEEVVGNPRAEECLEKDKDDVAFDVDPEVTYYIDNRASRHGRPTDEIFGLNPTGRRDQSHYKFNSCFVTSAMWCFDTGGCTTALRDSVVVVMDDERIDTEDFNGITFVKAPWRIHVPAEYVVTVRCLAEHAFFLSSSSD